MKRGWLWAVLLLSLGVNIGILSTIGVSRLRAGSRLEELRAQGFRPPPFARLADHLRLEGEQRERFLVIQQELFETTRRGRHRLEEVRTLLRREVMADDPDRERIQDLLRESAEVSRALESAMIESVLATREILDPGQQRRYFRVMERLREANRRFGNREEGPPRRPRRDP